VKSDIILYMGIEYLYPNSFGWIWEWDNNRGIILNKSGDITLVEIGGYNIVYGDIICISKFNDHLAFYI